MYSIIVCPKAIELKFLFREEGGVDTQTRPPSLVGFFAAKLLESEKSGIAKN
jgi:hypothetical protein